MSRRYVLDSFALLAYLAAERPGERVRSILTSGDPIYLCLINYGEVVYISERHGGRRAAEDVIRIVDSLPITIVPPDRRLTFAAAHWKAHHRLSYADAFVAALAESLEATIVTGDPELQALAPLLAIEWLESAG